MNFLQRVVVVGLVAGTAVASFAIEKVSRNPYLSAIVTDAATGAVLIEENADARGFPASITKLMTFFVVIDQVESGRIALTDPVTVSAEAARTGGSQVYLKQGEVFTVDDLLHALMIQSANDAAVALATHAAGSREAFVELMNAKARALGMTSTTFHSPHGLPPSKGQSPDVTTARDLARLSRELIRHGQVLRYSSIKERAFREVAAEPFIMRNHNGLLTAFPGCDGLKTGYFSAGGFSLAATAERNGRRLIAVVLGSEQRVVRDVKARELLERGFATVPPAMPVVSVAAPAPAPAAPPAKAAPMPTVKTVPADPAPAARAEQASTPKEPVVIFRVIPPEKKP
ncbi:D-alanyl-D-alanine carboxypeptidase DacF precursor [Lacunisphaera limnophila]|uniref:D-alanyl-D-alanine carboxypeptidase DacF n=1 Tax=Lacunisphaera limnophila TaxID=1838286 RepID=A0A1D8ASM1_9BACT|nr:D-alanyl-D-alanine carboxypeptidase family protein [Lacunisphaera limnophila]AOS43899.1 D-alanyl-D-alanine carboxypeptidase DacF precursor [Lacunisphaera limnophila]